MIQGSTRDYFTQEELIRIYEAAGSPEQEALETAARSLFPERMAAPEPPMLKSETGLHGRWFIRDDQPEEPAYTIKSGRCCWVGILKDGTALPY
ncbi:MAG: hypothetical protein LUD79_05535 [Oscillospiraceae bacterium]|nr:hypothetical protein [Oscillospiraceae bacterium]